MGRSNGGIIGVDNLPGEGLASGVWSLHEQSVNQLAGRFPVIPVGQDFTVSSVNSSATSSRNFGFFESHIGHDVSPDGTKGIFANYDALGAAQGFVYVETGNPFNFGALSVNQQVTVGSGATGRASGVSYSLDGKYLLVSLRDQNYLKMFSLSTPYDLRTATQIGQLDIRPVTNQFSGQAVNGASISDDGKKVTTTMQEGGGTKATTLVFELSNAYDITTGTLFSSGQVDIASTLQILGGDWNSTGTVYSYCDFGSPNQIYVKYPTNPWDAASLLNQPLNTFSISGSGNMAEPKFHYDAQKLTISQYSSSQPSVFVYDCVLNPV